jgi:hypothetical protein
MFNSGDRSTMSTARLTKKNAPRKTPLSSFAASARVAAIARSAALVAALAACSSGGSSGSGEAPAAGADLYVGSLSVMAILDGAHATREITELPWSSSSGYFYQIPEENRFFLSVMSADFASTQLYEATDDGFVKVADVTGSLDMLARLYRQR